ncbi:hypothetical protein OSB04_028549 [Centaurea solstitialis]|uniref:Uncharacterized protein n=1 Tax=Centaurea solstitialis TaxID=347529 RepID=A0AA38SNC6_9ASTR|nr:hypothetical protein OSB04_028549 [Centaurea solstitialis]
MKFLIKFSIHSDTTKMYKNSGLDYWWPGMKKDVARKKWVSEIDSMGDCYTTVWYVDLDYCEANQGSSGLDKRKWTGLKLRSFRWLSLALYSAGVNQSTPILGCRTWTASRPSWLPAIVQIHCLIQLLHRMLVHSSLRCLERLETQDTYLVLVLSYWICEGPVFALPQSIVIEAQHFHVEFLAQQSV